ncbi:MAG: hypothetical protein M1820_009071 [Bogoriella megaspora]|nr:MAG: hypothetical protein M1820_009071 [Bogoriella megaspora]
MSGYFDGLFWNRTILQLGHSEPTIKHAIMAVSSMYEQFESKSGLNPLLSTEEDRFTLTSYSKAIKSLSEKLGNDTQSVYVPLVACVLFICLEFLRRDIDAAMTHMHSGFAILRSRMTRSSRRGNSPGIGPTSNEKGIEETIMAIFARLRILSGLFGRPAPPMQVYEGGSDEVDESTPEFSTFAEARGSLVSRMAPALVFVRICSEARYDPILAIRYATKQTSLNASLVQWREAFEEWFSKKDKHTKEDRLAANMLRLHHGATYIWLNTCLCANETAFDDYTDKFNEMVNLAASLISANLVSDDNNSHFSFEMGTVPPLYFMAVKCRHPVIRRRAISLLLSSPRREGLWDAYRAGRVAERVLMREELGFGPATTYRESRKALLRAHETGELPSLSTEGDTRTPAYLTEEEIPHSERKPTTTSTESVDPFSNYNIDAVATPTASSTGTLPSENDRMRHLHQYPFHQMQDFPLRPAAAVDGDIGQSVNLINGFNPENVDLKNIHEHLSTGKCNLHDIYEHLQDECLNQGPSPLPTEQYRVHGTTYPETEGLHLDQMAGPAIWPTEEFHIDPAISGLDMGDTSSYPSTSHRTGNPFPSAEARIHSIEDHANNSIKFPRIRFRGPSNLPSEFDQRNPSVSSLTSSPPQSHTLSLIPVSTPTPTASQPRNRVMNPARMRIRTPTSASPGKSYRLGDFVPQQMPQEVHRIHDTRIANELPEKDTGAAGTIQPVTFRWKPNGLTGEWQVWGETIKL